jgi:hypothetical protein
LFGSPIEPFPVLAAGCATLKFGLILAGLLYVIVAVGSRLFKRV